jgi:hypothetical protein
MTLFYFIFGAQTFRRGLLRIGYEMYRYETYRCITYRSKTYRLLNISAFKHIADLIISDLKCNGIKHIDGLNISLI